MTALKGSSLLSCSQGISKLVLESECAFSNDVENFVACFGPSVLKGRTDGEIEGHMCLLSIATLHTTRE